VDASDLKGLAYLAYSPMVESGLEHDLLFKPARFAPSVFREAHSVVTILDLTASGGGSLY
jgi:hypothetical protein